MNYLSLTNQFFLSEYQKALDESAIISKTDINGKITYVNDKYVQLSGYTEKELLGSNHSLVKHEDMPQEYFDDLWFQLKNAGIFSGTLKNLKKNGEYFYIDVTIVKIMDPYDNATEYMSIANDVTTLIDARLEAQKASQAKEYFLSNMSHEIRTPLNAILGFVDLLKDESKGRKSLEYVDIIDSSSKSLLHIIEDILDFSKIESGKLNIDKIDFNSKREFEVITHLFSAKCSQKNISLTLELHKNLPKVINTDPLRIKQVISNLLSNAVKFTDDGKNIKVSIDYKDDFLNVSVEDKGKGIAKDKLLHIFDAFSQEDTSTTREYGGTGLGLAISGALVKLLGGELKVKSELGVGSEFYFSIPVEIGEEVKVISEDIKNRTFEGKKVLLVEDNKANQLFMKVLLKKLKLELDIANDGLEAIDKFRQSIASSENKYDVILMDENMPNLNGIEATKRIIDIEQEEELKHTPVIALTANALKGDREKFMNAGMDEYLTKPIDKIKLNEILHKFLN